MGKYDINVNVKAQKGGAVSGGVEGLSRASIRERSQQTQELRRAISTSSTRDPQFKVNQQLVRVISTLDKNVLKLNDSILKLDRTTMTQGRGGVVRGGAGLLGNGGAGGGAGGMGSSIPVAGAAIAAFGYAMSKVIQVGQANMAKRMEQAQTVGVAGFQTSGRQSDVLSAGEFGQYLKERRMQSGSFDTGGTGGSEYNEGSDVTKSKRMSFKQMALFGTSPAEMGRTVGTLDVLTGGKGEVNFNEMMTNLYTKKGGKIQGPGTQAPIITKAITDRMQEAVTAGVIDSNFAKDMAKEYSQMASMAGPGQSRFVLEAQKSMMNVQTAISKGELGGEAGFRMRMVTRDLINAKNPEGEKVRKQLEESGLFQPGTNFNKLSPEAMQTAVQYLNQAQSADVRNAFIRSTVQTYSGEGSEYEQFHRYRQNMMGIMPEIASDPKRAKLLFDVVKKQQAGTVTSDEAHDEMNKIITANEHNKVGKVKIGQGELDKLVLGLVGDKAAEATLNLQTKLIDFAGKMSGPITDGIDLFTESIKLGAKGMDELSETIKSIVDEIKKIKKQGIVDYFF